MLEFVFADGQFQQAKVISFILGFIYSFKILSTRYLYQKIGTVLIRFDAFPALLLSGILFAIKICQFAECLFLLDIKPTICE
jgi:hypothetical protein